MVNINGEQSRLLTQVKNAKADFDASMEQLQAEVAQQTDVFKQPLKDLISAGLAQGIPLRQIYLAMGFSQVNVLNNFLRPTAALTPVGRPTKAVNNESTRELLKPTNTAQGAAPAPILGSIVLERKPVQIEATRHPTREFEWEFVITDSLGKPLDKVWVQDVSLVPNERPTLASRYLNKYFGYRSEEEIELIHEAVEEKIKEITGRYPVWQY